MLEAGEYDPSDVIVEWDLGARPTMAPRATFVARQRAKQTRKRGCGESPAV